MYPFKSDFYLQLGRQGWVPSSLSDHPRSSFRAVTVHRNHRCKGQPKEPLALGDHCAMSHVGLLGDHTLCGLLGLVGRWIIPLWRSSQLFPTPFCSSLTHTSHEPPSLWRTQSCSLYYQTQLSLACSEDSLICDCNGLPAGKDDCLPPRWHCSFYLCHLVSFSFLISRGLHVSESHLFPGAFLWRHFFPADFLLASWVQERASLMLASHWFLLSGIHFLQLEARSWLKTSRLKVPIWEQTPHMPEKAN